VVKPSNAAVLPAAQAAPAGQGPAATAADGQSPPRRLSAVTAGEKVRLVRVDAGRGLNSRLAAMGFVPNVALTVVSNNHPGPFTIVIKGVKMMLGRGAAHKIIVT